MGYPVLNCNGVWMEFDQKSGVQVGLKLHLNLETAFPLQNFSACKLVAITFLIVMPITTVPSVQSELTAIRDLEPLERLANAILTAKSWSELLATP